MCFAYSSCCLKPRERIDAVHCARNGQVCGLRHIRVLRLTRKQKVRILHREREHLHVIPLVHKLLRQTLIKRRQSAPIRPCCSDYSDPHNIANYKLPRKDTAFFSIEQEKVFFLYFLCLKFVHISCFLFFCAVKSSRLRKK